MCYPHPYFRYTDIKDPVLVTTGDSDDLAEVVLGAGRLYSTLVPSQNNMDAVRASVHAAFGKAITRGMFMSGMERTPVVVGPMLLPESVPRNNLGETTVRALAERVEESDGDIPYRGHQLAVAQETARRFGLEIKVR